MSASGGNGYNLSIYERNREILDFFDEVEIPAFAGMTRGGRGIIDFLIITDIIKTMKKNQFPIIVEKGEDGFYVVECPIFHGCISQGKTLDDAIKNIKEAIELCLEEY